MINFRKLAAASVGKLLRAYFTENTPEPIHDPDRTPGRQLDPGGRLTAYYTGRDSRATWRPDMASSVARALGVDHRSMPKDADLDRLFEAKRADTGVAWSKHARKISAFDLTFAPHKSVTLAAEFAATAAESAAIWNAIDRANDAAMRLVARDLGWARKGKGGEEGADPGAVGWVSFRHHTARPTLPVQDGRGGATYLADVAIDGDPHAHIHNALFNLVVADDGRIGSLDTQQMTKTRLHIYDAYFQARLADELRALGARVSYHPTGKAITLEAIPQLANDTFSKSKRQVLRSAKAYAQRQGLTWDDISAEGKFKILAASGLAARLKKHGTKNDREIWREQAKAIGWEHRSVMDEARHVPLPDGERFDRAYEFAARHLAQEFHTAAVLDHDKLPMYAATGLIGTGIQGGARDIECVVALLEERGIELKGEHVALLVGLAGDKVRVTNTAQVRIEEALAREAKRAAADRSGALPTEAIRAVIDASDLDFDSEPDHGAAQKAAIYALGRGGALSLLTGVAGAGKSTLLQPLVAAWQADTRYDAGGREMVGLATGWKQADALKDAGIERTIAMQPLLAMIENGEFQASRNTVLVIDEISQVAPRAMLALLELQRQTGMTIKALGDREQGQSVEAGDAVELMRRVLSKNDRPELLSTVRQVGRTKAETQRLRTIAGLFRGGEPDPEASFEERQGDHLDEVRQALDMKREDGTAMLAGGDQDQVVGRIADLFMERRDVLLASGSKRGITVSTPTNADAADISQAIRERMKARGELGDDEVVYKAVARRGDAVDEYDLPLATGDRVRLFRRTWARINGKPGSIGNNGDIVEVVGHTTNGLRLRDKDGRVGEVEWRRLRDAETGRLLLGFGHALTIDAAQGITSDEHINALPRGTGGVTGFTAYVAESRARGRTWTVIAEAALFEAVKHARALGDATPVTLEDLWLRAAQDMAAKPYKPLGMDLAASARADRARAITAFIRQSHTLETLQACGRQLGREARMRVQAKAVRRSLPKHIAALDAAIVRNAQLQVPKPERELHLRGMRVEAEVARRTVEAAAKPRRPSPGPGM